jgi:hypothetical protein
VNAADNFNQRGFAGTVLSHEAVNLSLSNGKIHIVESLDPFKGFGNVFYFQKQIGHTTPPGQKFQNNHPGPFFLKLKFSRKNSTLKLQRTTAKSKKSNKRSKILFSFYFFNFFDFFDLAVKF